MMRDAPFNLAQRAQHCPIINETKTCSELGWKLDSVNTLNHILGLLTVSPSCTQNIALLRGYDLPMVQM